MKKYMGNFGNTNDFNEAFGNAETDSTVSPFAKYKVADTTLAKNTTSDYFIFPVTGKPFPSSGTGYTTWRGTNLPSDFVRFRNNIFKKSDIQNMFRYYWRGGVHQILTGDEKIGTSSSYQTRYSGNMSARILVEALNELGYRNSIGLKAIIPPLPSPVNYQQNSVNKHPLWDRINFHSLADISLQTFPDVLRRPDLNEFRKDNFFPKKELTVYDKRKSIVEIYTIQEFNAVVTSTNKIAPFALNKYNKDISSGDRVNMWTFQEKFLNRYNNVIDLNTGLPTDKRDPNIDVIGPNHPVAIKTKSNFYKDLYWVRKALSDMGYKGKSGSALTYKPLSVVTQYINHPATTKRVFSPLYGRYMDEKIAAWIEVKKVITYPSQVWNENDEHAFVQFKLQHGLPDAKNGKINNIHTESAPYFASDGKMVKRISRTLFDDLKIINGVLNNVSNSMGYAQLISYYEKDVLNLPNSDAKSFYALHNKHVASVGMTPKEYALAIIEMKPTNAIEVVSIANLHNGKFDYDGVDRLNTVVTGLFETSGGGFKPQSESVVDAPLVIDTVEKTFLDEEIMSTQKLLNSIGIKDALDRELVEDGFWNLNYEAALKKFQSSKSLEKTGIIDTNTIMAMAKVRSELNKSTILVNTLPTIPTNTLPVIPTINPVVVPEPSPYSFTYLKTGFGEKQVDGFINALSVLGYENLSKENLVENITKFLNANKSKFDSISAGKEINGGMVYEFILSRANETQKVIASLAPKTNLPIESVVELTNEPEKVFKDLTKPKMSNGKKVGMVAGILGVLYFGNTK